MKRGNANIWAVSIIFIGFLLFILFFSSNKIKPEITGYFNYAPLDQIIVPNATFPFNGNLNFTLTSDDITNSTPAPPSITNNSRIVLTLRTIDSNGVECGSTSCITASELSLEQIADKTIPKINFTNFAEYKAINESGNYKLNISLFNLIPPQAGNYSLTAGLYFNSTEASWQLPFVLTIRITVNASEIAPPPTTTPPESKAPEILNRSFQAIQFDAEGNITKIKTAPNGFIYTGDKLLCNINFTNTTAVNVSFFLYSPNATSVNLANFTSDSCKYINYTNYTAGFCQISYIVNKYQKGMWGCTIQLNASSVNFFYKYPPVTMPLVSRGPVHIKTIPNITLMGATTVNISLKDYFADYEDQSLTYGIEGTLHSRINVSGDIITFTSFNNYNGTDFFIFWAYDGSIYADSNNVTIFYNVNATTANTPPPANESPKNCTADWKCGSWDECINSQKRRVCVDMNSCNTADGKPSETEKCTMPVETTPAVTSKPVGIQPLGGSNTKQPESSSSSDILIPVIIICFGVLAIAGGGLFYYFTVIRGKKNIVEGSTDGSNLENAGQSIQSAVISSSGGIIMPSQTTEAPQSSTVNVTNVSQPVEVGAGTSILNINELYSYLDTIYDLSKAKKDLLVAGWPADLVGKAVNVITLKRYVEKKLKDGFDEQKIKDGLIAKGWKMDMINDVFEQVNKNKKN